MITAQPTVYEGHTGCLYDRIVRGRDGRPQRRASIQRHGDGLLVQLIDDHTHDVAHAYTSDPDRAYHLAAGFLAGTAAADLVTASERIRVAWI